MMQMLKKNLLGKSLGPLLLLISGTASAGYDVNGVVLGATEEEVLKRYPSAHCKPLQWQSRAADRRCDDGKIDFGGARARITFYLKDDRLQAYDVRFGTDQAEHVAAFLKSRWGAPQKETREKYDTKGRERELHRLEWKDGDTQAVLSSVAEKRRASVTVSRGNFEDEIYRIQ